MEQRRFASFNLTIFFFFFLLLPHLHASESRFHHFMHVLSNALVLSLSRNFLYFKTETWLYIRIYIHIYIYTHGEQFGYSLECKTHNCLPHRPLSVLINRLRPPHHTPLVELCRVRFRSVQAGFVGCGQNLNKPNSDTPHAISTNTWFGNVNGPFAWLHCLI